MTRSLAFVTTLLFVLLTIALTARADPPSQFSGKPDAASSAQAMAVVNEFAEAIYGRNFPKAFALVRGIPNPAEEGKRFQQVIRNMVAAVSFRQLSMCQINIEILAAGVESYARDHEGKYPPNLKVLLNGTDMYLTQLPTCPAGGTYEYRHDRQGYQIFCHKDAHSEIGVTGDHPAYASGTGLTLGEHKLNLDFEPQFMVKNHKVTVEQWIPDFNILVVRLDEDSAIEDVDAMHHRVSRFSMSRKDGQWLIDLFLSNRDMSFVYDFEKWQETETLPKQVLYFYLTRGGSAVTLENPGYMDRADLLLRVCESNLRSISLGIEAWSVDHAGKYPRENGLKVIVPRYMALIPRCPAGGVYVYTHEPHSAKFLVRCMGHAHANANVPPNYPTVDPVNGVKSRPVQ